MQANSGCDLDETATTLAKEMLNGATDETSIAVVSAPSVFVQLKNLLVCNLHRDIDRPYIHILMRIGAQNSELYSISPKLSLLEFDERFRVLKEYVYYDYQKPLQLPGHLKGQFDRIICDPPFLSTECQTKGIVDLSPKRLYKRFNKLLTPLPTSKMAWRSSGSSNAALIANLASNGLIHSDRVKQAMLKAILPVHGHLTTDISQAPHMHASAAESLLPYLHPAAKVLDIGSGSGYLTNVLANLVGPQGKVIGIDHIQALVDMSKKNMSKSSEGKAMLENGKVKLIVGDGRMGWKEDAPYDAIHVGAAAKEAHQELLDQLKSPGRLFIPVGERFGQQYIYVIDKAEDGSIKRSKEYGVSYVPLTDFDPNISE
ncbi:MAG: hypothetical protein LQ340_001809 [Diploschistes diacapsis]|nr:MAG: hypothetical protein LQ340_001809 [Diploschistes diacapsis]